MKDRKTTKPVNFRVTEEEYEHMKQQAEANQQSVSKYIASRVLGREGITLDQQREVYYHLMRVIDAIQMQPEFENRQEILEECDAIWQSLKL